MDSLSEQQRELIQKMSDERLRQKLSALVCQPRQLAHLVGNNFLLDAWAELVATGRDKHAYKIKQEQQLPSL